MDTNKFPLPEPSTPNITSKLPPQPQNLPAPPEPSPMNPVSPLPENKTSTPNLPAPEDTPPPPPDYQPPQPVASPASPSSSPFKMVIPIIIVLLVLGLIFFIVKTIINRNTTSSATSESKITLTYWGLWESPTVMQPVIDAFEKQNPHIKINYQMQSSQDYQQRLQSAIQSKNSPDVIRLHTSWLPLLINDLLPAPANSISSTELKTNFYPIISSTLDLNGQVYGVPFSLEGLALYLNRDLYQQSSLQPPENWDDLLNNAVALTTRDPQTNSITRAGIALGTTSNVAHWSDIVTLMLLQANVNLLDIDSQYATEAFEFYTSFAYSADRVWDDTQPNSIIAFANQKVAMILAPSWRAPEIQALNPNLAFDIAPVPQLPDSPKVNWASIWFEAVPKNSSHPQEAWQFLTHLSSAQSQQLIFQTATIERGVPQPPANKGVYEIAKQNVLLAPYLDSFATAQTFYTASLTHDADTAINSRLIKYLEDAVNAFVSNENPDDTITTLNLGFNQVLSQYGLVKAITVPSP